MLLVNTRLAYILRDVWYMHLPNNIAVLSVSTNIALLHTTADRCRLTINKQFLTKIGGNSD